MSLNARPRVLLADDYAGMITALDRLLRPSCDVVGHVADGAELVKAVVLQLPTSAPTRPHACQRLGGRQIAIDSCT